MSDHGFRDLVRLNEAERRRLLDRLDRTSRAEHAQVCESGRNKRADTRFDYRESNIPVAVEHPGGGAMNLLVCARNLSAGGMAFLHGGYLHKETHCRVILNRLDGSRLAAEGTVVNSRHVRGALHEVSVRFEHPIQIDDFMTREEQAAGRTEDAAALTETRGRLLYLYQKSHEIRQLRHCLANSAIKVTGAKTPGSAIDAVKLNRFDVVMVEAPMIEAEGVDLIADLRQAGHRGPLVVVTFSRSDPRWEVALSAGATHLYCKPFQTRTFLRFARDRINEGGGNRADVEFVLENVEHVRRLAGRIARAIEEQNDRVLRALCRDVKEAAEGTTLAPIRKAAESALRQLAATLSVEEALPELRLLADLCVRYAEGRDRGGAAGIV